MLALPRAYLIRLDDVAPTMDWEAWARAKALFARYGVRPLIGVIPDNRDPALLRFPTGPLPFWDEIRAVQALGWEVAMHGYQHRYDASGTNLLGRDAPSEFATHSFEEQRDRLARGLAVFAREGVAVRSFFAPSHSFDRRTVAALRELGIGSISDGYALFPFRKDGVTFVPQLLDRPLAFPVGVHTSVHHLNHYRAADFARLERFLAAHHERVIDYPAALRLVREGLPWRAAGRLCRLGLIGGRRAAHLLRAGAARLGPRRPRAALDSSRVPPAIAID